MVRGVQIACGLSVALRKLAHVNPRTHIGGCCMLLIGIQYLKEPHQAFASTLLCQCSVKVQTRVL